jgi:ketosteroid isomerase-like protein
MTTRDAIDRYFTSLQRKQGWDTFFADDVVFTSFTSPVKRVSGKAAFLESTRRFYSTIASVEVKDVLVDGDKACVLTHYQLQSPAGAIASDVAEVFHVRDGKIASFEIYFDSAPFPK